MSSFVTKAAGALLACAGLVAAISISRLGATLPGAAIELSNRRVLHVQPELRELLNRATAAVYGTYYVSPDSALTADRRAAKDAVVDLLANLRDSAPGRFDFAVVHPEEDPDLAEYASTRRVSSFRALSVHADEDTTKPIYSSLTLEQSGSPTARIEHIGPEHLGDLQAILFERLAAREAPTEPRILLARPAQDADRFSTVEEALSRRGELRTVDLAETELDLWSDFLFWMAPTDASPDSLAKLERYLESGRSAVVAGRRSSKEARTLFRELGLEVSTDRILAPFQAGKPNGEVASLVPSIAPDQDFRRLTGQPNGTLYFEDPGSFSFLSDVFDARGTSARRIATSFEATQIEGADGPVASPKRSLAVLLEPADARRGSLVAFAAPTPFEKGFFAMEGAAHRPLVTTLIDSFGGEDRRAVLRAGVAPPERIGDFTVGQRALARALLWLPLPLLLIATWWLRRRGAGPAGPETQGPAHKPSANSKPRLAKAAPTLLAATFLIALSIGATHAPNLRLDLTSDKLNTPSKVTLEVAAALAEVQPKLIAQLYFSAPGKLEPSLAALPQSIAGLLADIRDQGLNVTVSQVRPSRLSPQQRSELAALGLAPFRATRAKSATGDVAGAQEAWASLRLVSGEQIEVLEFQDAAEAEQLEFRLAFALERIRKNAQAPGAGTVKLGFASDLPRMSAAEDYEYQSKGSFAPREGDVFQLARQSLARAGFQVEHIDPRSPLLGSGADPSGASAVFDHEAVLWIQPRRNALPMLSAFQHYLRRGGNGLLAAQHFRTQARQYRGSDFELVYWPQPQLPDVDRYWFPEFGVDLVREVLFDEDSVTLPIDTRILGKGTELKFQPEATRAPFLIKASASNFSDASLMRGVGDLALADPNWIRLDQAKLKESGLSAEVLFTGSDRAWHADWQGGWLTDEMLGGPRVAPTVYAVQPRPALGVHLRGAFPAPIDLGADASGVPITMDSPAVEDLAEGQLVFVGNSSFLTDTQFKGAGFRGDSFLLAAAANLALGSYEPFGPALADLAGKRPIARGFGVLSAEAKRDRRLLVVLGAASLLALGLGLWRLARRGRKAPGQVPYFGMETAQSQSRSFSRGLFTPALVPVAIAFVTFALSELTAQGLESSRTGTLRLGRLAAPELRELPVSSLRITRAPGTSFEASWTWAEGSFGGGPGYDPMDATAEPTEPLRGDPNGSWREITGIGALGDVQSIDKTIESIFAAEGIVVHPGGGDVSGYGFDSPTSWRIELFPYQNKSDHRQWDEPTFVVEVGSTSRDGLSAYLRVPGDGAIWSSDINPAAYFGGRLRTTFPPLADQHLIPRSWPGMTVGIAAFAWQKVGGTSLRLVSSPAGRTPEELQAGRSPMLWTLVGKGENTPMEDGPGTNARGGAAAANALIKFIMQAEASALLDPAQAASYGMGPGDTPFAILLLDSNPLPSDPNAPNAEPVGIPLMLRIGPELGPEQGGGHALINTFTGNLVRVPKRFVDLVLPTAEDFEGLDRQRAWQQGL